MPRRLADQGMFWYQPTMTEHHDTATLAALIGDSGRVEILSALKDGRALTAIELAHALGAAPQTVRGDLAKLRGARLVGIERQGPHRYYRLADPRVAAALATCEVPAAPRFRPTGPREPGMRFARSCYRHLAGVLGVALTRSLVDLGYLGASDGDFTLTATGAVALGKFGIDIDALKAGGRPLARRCLDWSERRPHLGGALGVAILSRAEALGWLGRSAGSRAVTLTKAGREGLRTRFSVDLEPPARML